MQTPPVPAITAREAEVLDALADRLSNAEIAADFHLSVRTVESHVASLLRKLGAQTRRDLATLAQRARTTRAVVEPISPGRTTPVPAAATEILRSEPEPASPAPRVVGLPRVATTFVGRGQEHDDVLRQLAHNRLITLLGPGGVGKTRLAAVIAESAAPAFPAGCAFVDLVPVRDGFVAQAVAAAFGATARAGVALEDVICERLGRERVLLVLDNCEHLPDAVAGFAERILAACPGVRLLLTSRERLGVAGEQVVAVAPLPLGSDAEALFQDRATAADPEFAADPATISEICAQLDGIPLAIELAAARSASLGANGLTAGLHDLLRLLAGGRGGSERHRSLSAIIGWSHELLTDEEQRLFRRLAIFLGQFDLDAAEAVAGDLGRGAVADVLGHLVDKSLIVHQRGGAGRWRMLQTVRAFAADRLSASAEHTDVRVRYLNWAKASATQLEAQLGGDWRPGFDAIVDDLRVALIDRPDNCTTVAHQLARSLGHLSYARRFIADSLSHYLLAAELAPTPIEAARDLRDAAACSLDTISGDQVFQLLLASAERSAAGGDGNAQATAMARAVEMAGRFPASFPEDIAHHRLRRLLDDAIAVGDQRQPVVAASIAAAAVWIANEEKFNPDPELAAVAEATAKATGDPVLISASLDGVGTAASLAGRRREAHQLTRQRLELIEAMDRNAPHSAVEIIDTLHVATTDAIAIGDLRAAMAAARLIENDDLIGDHPYLAASRLIPTLVLIGEFDKALRSATRMWDGWERLGRPAAGWLTPAVAAIALAHGLRGDMGRFRLWRSRTADVAGAAYAAQVRLTSFGTFVDARVAIQLNDKLDAVEKVKRAFAAFPRGRYEAYAQAAGAELAVIAGLPDAAERLTAAAAATTESYWAAACIARANGRYHNDQDALIASVDGWEQIGARFERACTLLLIPHRAAEGRAELLSRQMPTPPQS
ncbi:LuxR C-terminal-related transcriptional regulator [Micromonospora lupini]|uniref:ATP-binding protein n=1 Tax=Micromonospora lupini TaxID=285679 RepID=UPI00225C1AF2|nr:LuxR C-terminal-related transcriptional regulator [Micromonospora lupini]MCX5065993.1 LuxR C-terminal-related transcriptional regulator [Micromonospora lupini]